MKTPVEIQDRASVCREPRAYFQDTFSYNVGVIQDTFTLKSEPGITHGNSSELLALGLFARVPEAQWAFTFLDFGIDSLLTNGQLQNATLSIETAINDPNNPLPSATTPDYPFLLMKTPWDWNAETLTYNNQPDLGPGVGVSVSSDNLIPNTNYLYQKEITPFVNDWLSGTSQDYGLMIESEGRYTFASMENTLGAVLPQLSLSLSALANSSDNILVIGNVQAGDTLEIQFPTLSKGLGINEEVDETGIEADDQVIFFGRNDCLDSRIRALPLIDSATEDRYFEFVSNLETNIPIDSTETEIYEEYFEPNLLYDNATVQAPDIFNQYFMEIYDAPFIEYPDGSSFPLANFFDPEEFEYPLFVELNRRTRGALLQVDNAPENEGLSFKIRVAGWMVKGLSAGKVATAPVENELLAMLMDTGNNVVLSNIDDPNCSFPTDIISENVFTNCFEFTIGGKNRLFVEAEPDSIYPGGASVLTAKLITAEGDTVDFPPNQVFEVSIDEEFRDLGTLLSTTNDTADVITNNGPVFGFLSDSPVGEPQTVSITLITAYEAVVLRGSKGVGLKAPFDLAIVLDDDAEVQPTLRVGNGTNNLEEFSVTVLENGIGIPNHEVELTLRLIPGTGGHDHLAAPAELLLGSLENTVTNDSGIGRLTTRTNQEGVINIEYTSTEIGGQIEIKARSTTQFNEVVDSLRVRVPNLILFQGAGSYTLTGETTSHLENHYLINQQAINSLLGASTAFKNAEWNTTGEMRLNDMSLEFGGLFDISGQWRTPHNSHRTGRDVDIENISARDTTLMVFNPVTGVTRERTVLLFESDWIEQYERLMLQRSWFFIDEGQNNPNRNSNDDQPGIRYPHFNWRGN